MSACATAVMCSSCGKELEAYQASNPRLDPADKRPLCDDCWHDNFEFTCCACEEYGDIKNQHRFLVVFEDVDDVAPGIYKVTGRPYFTSGLIGSSWLHPHSLKRLAGLPFRFFGYRSITGKNWYHELTSGDHDYPCGHLCDQCQMRFKKELLRRKRISRTLREVTDAER